MLFDLGDAIVLSGEAAEGRNPKAQHHFFLRGAIGPGCAAVPGTILVTSWSEMDTDKIRFIRERLCLASC